MENPDLIILDLMMPGRSGWDVLEDLRSNPTTACTPVIVLTARTQDADRAAGIAAGADYYLTKPFRPTVLAGLVGELLT